MATGTVRKTGYIGIEMHSHSIRVDFMYKGVRHPHTLGIDQCQYQACRQPLPRSQ